LLKSTALPTGVGKTEINNTNAQQNKKHPHGRGEDPSSVSMSLNVLETPPRA